MSLSNVLQYFGNVKYNSASVLPSSLREPTTLDFEIPSLWLVGFASRWKYGLEIHGF